VEVFYGVIVVVGMIFVGLIMVVISVRRWVVFVFNECLVIVWVVVGVVFFLFVLWGGMYVFCMWWGILLLVVLIVIGVVVLCCEIL